jgi:LacI family transcriptional regulator
VRENSSRILFFRRSLCELSRREFCGISRYAEEAGWTLQTIEYDGALDTLRLKQDVDVNELLDFWRPSGCIVACGGEKPKLDIEDFAGVPTVFLDVFPSLLDDADVPHVASDSVSTAAVAARELLSLGFDDYAFVPFISDTVWSRERGSEFARMVGLNGKKMHWFRCGDAGRTRKVSASRYHKELSQWIVSLPKPCGVFVANDVIAREVVSMCHKEGLAVPDEVAVVGVDDDESICENAHVSISSVRNDIESAGYLAGLLLSRRMAGCPGPISLKFGTVGIVRRQSTARMKAVDVRVFRAMELIRKTACEGVTPAKVAEEMGCSRRFADMRFRELTGRTVLDEIHSVRLSKVKRLLAQPGTEISMLPAVCGYASLQDLCRVFKKREGMTMRKFRDVGRCSRLPDVLN